MTHTVLQWLDAALYSVVGLLVLAAAWVVLRTPRVPYKARERERAREYAWKCFLAFLGALWEVARS